MGRTLVPQSTLNRRLLRQDLRYQADARRRAARLPAFLRPEVVPYVTVTIVPLNDGPVVDVALEPIVDEDPTPYDEGSACSLSACGGCGRCF
jgi:hypothetical protein